MDRTDREIIELYFQRLKEGEKPARDPDAEALIAEKAVAIPGALYYLVQASIVSEHALTAAHNRIQEVEYELSRKSSGLFGSLFGGVARPPAPVSPPDGKAGLFSAPPVPGQAQRPGFLATAMQTAAGVAGGMLLANVIGQLLTPGTAEAAIPEEKGSLGAIFDDDDEA